MTPIVVKNHKDEVSQRADQGGENQAADDAG
jgi:hypothetical protein